MGIFDVGIIGSGVMGSWLARTAIRADLRTTLVAVTAADDEALQRRREGIEAALAGRVADGTLTSARRDSALAHLTVTSDFEALGECNFVVEAVVEQLGPKQRMLMHAERVAPADAVLATISPTLPPGDVGRRLQSRERFVAMHFLCPALERHLVEIGSVDETLPETLARAHAFARTLDHGAVTLPTGDSSRIAPSLVRYICDAIDAVEAGSGRPSAVDAALRGKRLLGPLALADELGLDVVEAMTRALCFYRHDASFAPPRLLGRLIAAGDLGRKTGRGIYDHRPGREGLENPAAVPITVGGEMPVL